MSPLIKLLKIGTKSILTVSCLLFLLILSACSISLDDTSNTSIGEEQTNSTITSPLTSFAEVAQYIREHGELPPNYITKNEAKEMGWVASEGNLHLVAPGYSIGGDKFGNREGLLPKADGRVWYEADINYESGTRNANRIVFSNDGLIFMTTDHYASFTDITEEGSTINE